MATTIYLSVRGDGSWRVLEVLRRALGEDAASLVVQPNRDDSGFYGSADVGDVAAAREAFAAACRAQPGLKAYLGAPPPEREEAPRRSAPRQPEPGKAAGGSGASSPNGRAPRRRPVRGRGRGGDGQGQDGQGQGRPPAR